MRISWLRRVYTSGGYVLGIRCSREHSGNRRYVLDGEWAVCEGCSHVLSRDACARYRSRAEALTAEQEVR